MVMKPWKLGTAWLVAATLALGTCATQSTQDTAPTTRSTPTSTPITAASTTVAAATSDFPSRGPVEPGTYHIERSPWVVAGFTMTMSDGWETQYGAPGAFKDYGPDGEVGFGFGIVDGIYADPCVGSEGEAGGEVIELGPSVDDLANALLQQPHTVATGPVDTTLGGVPAKRIDLTMAGDPETATCNIDVPGNLQLWHHPPTDDYFVLSGGASASVFILDLNGERQVFTTQYPADAPEDAISELQTIIDSITIDR
jgi:hypothetical protein